MEKSKSLTVESYIDAASEEDQAVLHRIRQAIKKVVSTEAVEVISYQMPAFRLNRVFIYYAAFKDHYSLFIPPNYIFDSHKEELAKYHVHKATIQFKKSEPIPYDLISALARDAAHEAIKHAAEGGDGQGGY